MYKIPANTLFIGKKLVFVPECHSTNTLAQKLIQESGDSVADGTVIITDHQTAGRGQRGNSWEASPGKNLTFSVVLRPRFLPIKRQFYLTAITSLAINDLLRDKMNAVSRIKWPNDILVEGKKLSGILIENQIQGQQVSNSVIGIGLNINQKQFAVGTATSMSLQSNVIYDRDDILEHLLVKLERRYLELREGKMSALLRDYHDNLYWKDELHVFSSNGSPFEGTISGVDDDGRLVVKTLKGDRTFDLKEIQYLQ